MDSQTKTLSEFLPTSLEAFLILAYENGYDMWRKEARNKQKESGLTFNDKESGADGDENSEEEAVFKFTHSARGARRAEGWSNEGLCLFNKLFDAIDAQRKDEDGTGLAFERDFLAYDEDEAVGEGEDFRDVRNNWADSTQYQLGESAEV